MKLQFQRNCRARVFLVIICRLERLVISGDNVWLVVFLSRSRQKTIQVPSGAHQTCTFHHNIQQMRHTLASYYYYSVRRRTDQRNGLLTAEYFLRQEGLTILETNHKTCFLICKIDVVQSELFGVSNALFEDCSMNNFAT